MPIDPGILLQARPPEPVNMLAQYAQITGIQNAQQQNALAKLQYRKEEQTLADATETKNALAAYAGGGMTEDALTQLARTSPAAYFNVIKLKQEQRKTDATIDKDVAETALKRLGALSGSLAGLAQKPDVSHDDLIATVRPLAAMGLVPQGWERGVPLNALELPNYVRGLVASTEQGRKALEMLLPNLTDAGGSLVDKNPLSGTFKQPVVAKTATPGETMTDTRTREQMAEAARHNRTTEGLTARGQNMTDARAREAAEQGKTQIVTDDAGNISIVNKGTGVARPAVTAEGAPLKGKDKALTEAQGKATGFSMRARESADLLNELEGSGTFGRVSGTKEGVRQSLERIPVVGTAAGNAVSGLLNPVTSGAQQKYEQAKRDFINAVLRVESGATITSDEFANADRQYFPKMGDSEAVIAQKRANRETAIKALTAQAGPGVKNIPASRVPVGVGGKLPSAAEVQSALDKYAPKAP